MAAGKSYSTIILGAERVWPRLTDFNQWQNWLWIPDGHIKGIGETIKAVKGDGSTIQLGYYWQDRLMQECRIKDWNPPQHLTLALEEWNPANACYNGKAFISGRRGLAIGRIKAMKVYVSLDLKPTPAGETFIEMRLETDFQHSFFGPIFNLFPLGGELNRICDVFLQRFSRSL